MKLYNPAICLAIVFIAGADCYVINNADGDDFIGEKGQNVTLTWKFNAIAENIVLMFYKNNAKPTLIGYFYVIYAIKTEVLMHKSDRLLSGSCKFPNENGTCEMTISDLQYNDEDVYFAVFQYKTIGSVNMIIKGGPEKCGKEKLPQNYTCSTGDAISGNITLCGKPPPDVKWYIGNDKIIENVSNESTTVPHKYNHSFRLKITSDMCGKKVSYKATGFKDIVKGSSTVLIKEFNVTNVVFTETQNECPEVTWKAGNHGLCDVKMVLIFKQNDNTTMTVTVPVSNETYAVCKQTRNATRVEYRTIVYLIENGIRKQISVDNNTKKTTPITRATTIMDPHQEETSWLSTWAVGIVIAALVLVLVVLVLGVVYCKRKKPNKSVQKDEQQSIYTELELGSGYLVQKDKPQSIYTELKPGSGCFVQKDEGQQSIYSELGHGGGRVGPKPVIDTSHYAYAKNC